MGIEFPIPKRLKEKVIVEKSNSIGNVSEWEEYFRCRNCTHTEIKEEHKFCPMCSLEIDWRV